MQPGVSTPPRGVDDVWDQSAMAEDLHHLQPSHCSNHAAMDTLGIPVEICQANHHLAGFFFAVLGLELRAFALSHFTGHFL
jgi:hypothetical protein